MPQIQIFNSLDNSSLMMRISKDSLKKYDQKSWKKRNVQMQRKDDDVFPRRKTFSNELGVFYFQKLCFFYLARETNTLINNLTNALKVMIKRNGDAHSIVDFDKLSKLYRDEDTKFATDEFSPMMAKKVSAAAAAIYMMHQGKNFRMLQQKIIKLFTLIFLISSAIHPTLAQARHFECSLEQREDQEFCVFRNVRLQRNEAGVTFGFPGSTAPSNVAFEMCNIQTLPASFWNTFGENLQNLDAESSGLKALTITNKMEKLHMRNNSINALTVQQNCNLNELDVSNNKLGNIQGILKCNKLETLNLNDNEDFASGGVLDLTTFRTLTSLQELHLSNVGILYMENTKHVGVPTLHTMDLSRNRIIPSDLSIDIFVPFTGLENLKLNNNAMGRLDYRQLGDIKSLKAVYLNGNSFKCDYLVDMLDILHQFNIETPTDRVGSCQPNDRELDGMCCLPSAPLPPPPPPPRNDTSTEKPDGTTKPPPPTVGPVVPPTETSTPAPQKDSNNTIIIIGSIIGGIIALAIAGFTFVKIRSKSQHQGVSQDDRELDKL